MERSQGVVIMSIEFRNCVIGGMNFISANVNDVTLCLLNKDGSEIRIMGAVIIYDHLKAILSKMKELQSEVNK